MADFNALNTAEHHHRRPLIAIWTCAVFLILVTGWHVFSLIDDNHQRELVAAERDLSNLTRVSQEHANRTLRSADQALRFVTERYLELGTRLDLSSLTTRGVIDTEIFNQVGIIDAQGILVLSNLPIKTRLDLSDRAHFKVHVTSDTAGLFVSQPVLGRASGRWSIQLSRRITRPNGEFAGVVVVSIDPGYFTRFYGELKLGSQGVVALYGLDGVARARKVGTREEFGSNGIKSSLFAAIGRGEFDGTYSSRSVVDGVDRLYYYRKIPNYQLVVVAGLAKQEMLANSVRARDALLLQAGLLSVLTLILAWGLTRYLVRMRRFMAAREFAQHQAQDRTEQLNAIFALSPDGFVSFDRERRVKYMNPGFIQMTALGERPLEGMDEHDFSVWLASRCESGIAFAGVSKLRAQITGDKPQARDLIEISANGKRVLQVALRRSESHTVSQILYFRDVTHETEVDQMKSEFLSTAAHELRTPMASILGFSELLLTQETDPASQQEFLNIIHEQSKLMANILDELLDLARIEARQGKDFRYTRVFLQEFSMDVLKSLKLPPGRDFPEMSMPDLPLYVMADEGKLRQAILNVLTNAYKYSPGGGPVIFQIASHGDQICFHISDRGLGMTPAHLGRVFERFFRADNSGQIPGTGLGMSIVKEIVELHHGEISMDSTLGTGTRVSLCLPTNRTTCNDSQR